jgi:hypothetical protein
MIRTKQPQVIDAMNRRDGIVYIKALNRTENEQAQTVSFDVELYTLESATTEEPVKARQRLSLLTLSLVKMKRAVISLKCKNEA